MSTDVGERKGQGLNTQIPGSHCVICLRKDPGVVGEGHGRWRRDGPEDAWKTLHQRAESRRGQPVEHGKLRALLRYLDGV